MSMKRCRRCGETKSIESFLEADVRKMDCKQHVGNVNLNAISRMDDEQSSSDTDSQSIPISFSLKHRAAAALSAADATPETVNTKH